MSQSSLVFSSIFNPMLLSIDKKPKSCVVSASKGNLSHSLERVNERKGKRPVQFRVVIMGVAHIQEPANISHASHFMFVACVRELCGGREINVRMIRP